MRGAVTCLPLRTAVGAFGGCPVTPRGRPGRHGDPGVMDRTGLEIPTGSMPVVAEDRTVARPIDGRRPYFHRSVASYRALIRIQYFGQRLKPAVGCGMAGRPRWPSRLSTVTVSSR